MLCLGYVVRVLFWQYVSTYANDGNGGEVESHVRVQKALVSGANFQKQKRRLLKGLVRIIKLSRLG